MAHGLSHRTVRKGWGPIGARDDAHVRIVAQDGCGATITDAPSRPDSPARSSAEERAWYTPAPASSRLATAAAASTASSVLITISPTTNHVPFLCAGSFSYYHGGVASEWRAFVNVRVHAQAVAAHSRRAPPPHPPSPRSPPMSRLTSLTCNV